MVRLRGRLAAVGVIPLAIALTVAGCSQGDSPTTGSDDSPGGSTAVRADPSWGHVHNLLIEGDDLLLGTHAGLWRQPRGVPATLVSEDKFDVMGLTGNADRYLASGHPAPGQRAPNPLGLIESTDGGRTWQTVSLGGRVDFHSLAADGDLVLGVDSGGGGLLRSLDRGQTWNNLPGVTPFGLAINPTDGRTVMATTRQGPLVSNDAGSNFTPLAEAPPVVDVTWTKNAVYGVTADGILYRSTNGGVAWALAGSVKAAPMAIAADNDRVVILAGGTIWESLDAGQSFTPRITDVPGGH